MLAICPNPTIDRLVILDSLVPGTVQRVRENRAYPAGKSVSAARGCLANGASPQVLALLPTDGADWYLATMRAEGMDVTVHPCPGAVRESIIVIEDAGRVSVLNGSGAPVTAETWDAFAHAATVNLSPGQWVICSGSFPPGVAQEALPELVAAIAASGARLALDTGPAWMPLALHGPAMPTLISPNLAEAEAILTGDTVPEATSVAIDALARAAVAAKGLHERGIEAVVVTAGSAGLAWATREGTGALAGQPVAVRNPIGAGDAFLGGLVSRLEAGLPFAAAAAWGMATSCAAIEQWAPGGATADRVAHFHKLITSS